MQTYFWSRKRAAACEGAAALFRKGGNVPCLLLFISRFFAGMAEPAVGAPAAATGASAFALLPVVNAPGCHSYKNSRHQYADKDGWKIHLESLLSFYGFMEMDGKRSVKRLVYANL